MSCTRRARLEGLPDARCWRWRARGQTEWELPARRQLERNHRAPKVHQIAALMQMSAFGGKADMAFCAANVRF